jgi:hypothetical protein
MVVRMRGIFQQPKFSVTVWVKKTDQFEAIRENLISLAGAEPFESTEYEGMVDFHWGFEVHSRAEQLANCLKGTSRRPEIVVLRISSLDGAVAPSTLKDERLTRH